MKNDEQIFHTLKTLTLTEEARASMRQRLSEYADAHPLHAKAIPTPFSFAFIPRVIGVFGLMLAVLLTGTGITYAAESAVPGDFLYAVKRNVNEPVIASLASTPEAKAKIHASFAERRLEEATKLAVADRLDASTSEQLSVEFESSVRSSNSYADELETEGRSDTALAVRSDLEARLSAHAQILALVAEAPAEENEREEVKHMARLVAQRASLAALVRSEVESTVTAKPAAMTKKTETPSNAVALATEEVEPVAQVALKSARVQEIVDEAEVLAEADKPEEAFVRTQEAARAATEASIFKKNGKLLRSLKDKLSTTTKEKPDKDKKEEDMEQEKEAELLKIVPAVTETVIPFLK